MEFMRCFPLTNKTQASTVSMLIHHSTGRSSKRNKTRKGSQRKGQTEKDGIKLARFADDMLVYTKKNPKKPTTNAPRINK